MNKKEITQLSYGITGCAIRVHKALGPGLLESIYQKCLHYELEIHGYDVVQQLPVTVQYRNIEFDTNFKSRFFRK